jgi:hypothetical protein
VLTGALRIETPAGDVTARPGQLVTFETATWPARGVALADATTLLVLSAAPARPMPANDPVKENAGA